jgi:hypothetical protein
METIANPLTELIPAAARKYVYALLALASLVYGAYQAADGDWKQTLIALAPVLVGGLAASNTAVKATDSDYSDPDLSPDLQGHADEADAPVEDEPADEFPVDDGPLDDTADEVNLPAEPSDSTEAAPASTPVDEFATDLS